MVLIGGVILLTHKKPEPKVAATDNQDTNSLHTLDRVSISKKRGNASGAPEAWAVGDDSESEAEHTGGEPSTKVAGRIGSPSSMRSVARSPANSINNPFADPRRSPVVQKHAGPEGKGLIGEDDDDVLPSPIDDSPSLRAEQPLHVESAATRATGVHLVPGRRPLSRSSSIRSDGFGDWEDAGTSRIIDRQ